MFLGKRLAGLQFELQRVLIHLLQKAVPELAINVEGSPQYLLGNLAMWEVLV